MFYAYNFSYRDHEAGVLYNSSLLPHKPWRRLLGNICNINLHWKTVLQTDSKLNMKTSQVSARTHEHYDRGEMFARQCTICSEFHCSLYGSYIRVCQCLSEPQHDLFVCFYRTRPTIKLRNCENDSVVVFPTYVSCWSVTLEKWKKDATQCLCCDWRAVIIIHLAAASDNVEVMYSHWRRRSVALPASSSSSSSPTSSPPPPPAAVSK